MEQLIENLKRDVIAASKNPAFIHHEWFADYHLTFVEQISRELCERYPAANKDIVLTLVWVHDYLKILDKENEHNEALFYHVKEKLLTLGFAADFVETVVEYLAIFEKKLEVDLHTAPLEVQIVSSADGASHLIGPFWSIYFKENSDRSLEELMASNRKKLAQDWERKIVLPEVKQVFEKRHDFLTEQQGAFPEEFLS